MTNILLADDFTITRAGLKMFIERQIPHAAIDEACDGDSAFEKIKEKNYELIILDVNMPGTRFFWIGSQYYFS